MKSFLQKWQEKDAHVDFLVEYFYMLIYHSLHSLYVRVQNLSSRVEGLSKLNKFQCTYLNDLLTGDIHVV